MRNQVQLITYVDRLAGNLRGLQSLLRGSLQGLFGGVHLLPFFHPIDGADAGFDPIDHASVDSRVGAWSDVQALGTEFDIMADVIVNHISSRSAQFLDFLQHGAASSFAGMFLTFDRVFPQGAAERDLLKLYRPRPGLPFSPATLQDGSRRILWTTFTPRQIDIDVTHPRGIEYLDKILETFAANGVRIIRLDAVGYAIKKAGQSCFMMDETFEFIAAFSERAQRRGLQVLVEAHSHYLRQIEIARHVDWVYDFALPPLVLHAFFKHRADRLKHWLQARPSNCLTVLDTHDSIGIIDVDADSANPHRRPGLVTPDEMALLVAYIHFNSKGDSARAAGSASNLDLYQVNCTFYDALQRNDTEYLLARAIQFFVPGIPQVYYVGLLAGSNDMELLARTGVGRDINRHFYRAEEVEQALARPVVARLLDLIRLRNTHPAFAGEFVLPDTPGETLHLKWTNAAHFARLQVDFRAGTGLLEYSSNGTTHRFEFAAH